MTRESQFVVTVDTEADDEWAGAATRTYRNLLALPRLQNLCDEFGALPTYLVTHDVAMHPEGSAIIRDLAATARCEVGAHLHAWTTPPHVPQLEPDARARPYLSEYEAGVQRRKLENLTDAVTELSGSRPTSYRGGRWDVDMTCLDLLDELGYAVDTSVTPLVSWRRARGVTKGGPAHALAPQDAYRPARNDLYHTGDHPLLEVPVTIGALGLLQQSAFAWMAAGLEHRRLLWAGPKRLMAATGIAARVWLDPVSTSSEDMIKLCSWMMSRGTRCLNMAFHSSELAAGCAPDVPDDEAAARVWRRLRDVLEFAASQPEIGFSTLTELAAARGAGPKCYAGVGQT